MHTPSAARAQPGHNGLASGRLRVYDLNSIRFLIWDGATDMTLQAETNGRPATEDLATMLDRYPVALLVRGES